MIGGYGVGMTMRVPAAPEAGETVGGGVLSVGHGGKGSNQAVGAARLGARVSLFTAIGPDTAGEEARRFWQAEGVDCERVHASQAPTMTGFIIVDPTGENRICIAPGALDDLTAELVEPFRESIARAELLVVSLEVPLGAAAAALRIAEEEGVRTLLNPAPAGGLGPEIWTGADIVTPNRTEAAIMLGDSADLDPAEAARRLHERSGAIAIVTAGRDGVHGCGPDGAFRAEAFPVAQVVDTTGAGDAFTAALAVALTEGLPLEQAARFAAAAGAYAVTIAEVIPALPTRRQLEDFMRAERQ